MTALTDYQGLITSTEDEMTWLDATKKVIRSAEHINKIYLQLKKLADSGALNGAPDDLKAELNFYYQQLTSMRANLVARPAFIEIYNTINKFNKLETQSE